MPLADQEMDGPYSQWTNLNNGDHQRVLHRQGLFKVDPLAGSRFVSERLNPSGYPGNGGLDEVIRRHIQ